MPDPYDLERFDHEHDGRTRPVFRRGDGPAVVLIHELPGMSPACTDLGRRLADEGFTAYLPLLFGSPNMRSGLRGGAAVCVRSELRLLAKGQASPVTDWVRSLCRRAARERPGRGVAVIGMCFTGGMVFSLVVDESVAAGVSSQPATPVMVWSGAARRSLGVPDADVEAAARSGKPMLALRFRHDIACPAARFAAIEERLPTAEIHQVPEQGSYRDADPRIRRFAHSVLTDDFVDVDGHPTRAAMDRVVAFLTEHLSGAG